MSRQLTTTKPPPTTTQQHAPPLLHQSNDKPLLDRLIHAQLLMRQAGESSDKDAIRKRMIGKIVQELRETPFRTDGQVLQQRQRQDLSNKKKPLERSDRELYETAKTLEKHLLDTSISWEEYQDESTLKRRLQYVAHYCRKSRRTTWQSAENDRDLRLQMIRYIQSLIAQRLPPRLSMNTNYVKSRLPLLAQRVEGVMYRVARSREEYADPNTVKYRLHGLALEYHEQPQQYPSHEVYTV